MDEEEDRDCCWCCWCCWYRSDLSGGDSGVEVEVELEEEEEDGNILNAIAICICVSSGNCGASNTNDELALELFVRRWARDEIGFW